MKCNVRELAQLSDGPCVIEGRLNYKKISNASYRNPAGESLQRLAWLFLTLSSMFMTHIQIAAALSGRNMKLL